MSNATIFFFYQDGRFDTRQTSLGMEETDIAYWLKKSPGMDPVAEIKVVPAEYCKSYMYVFDKMAELHRAYIDQLEQERERAEYERLRNKFERPNDN